MIKKNEGTFFFQIDSESLLDSLLDSLPTWESQVTVQSKLETEKLAQF